MENRFPPFGCLRTLAAVVVWEEQGRTQDSRAAPTMHSVKFFVNKGHISSIQFQCYKFLFGTKNSLLARGSGLRRGCLCRLPPLLWPHGSAGN